MEARWWVEFPLSQFERSKGPLVWWWLMDESRMKTGLLFSKGSSLFALLFCIWTKYCSSKWALLLLLVPFLWWQIRLLCLVLAGSLTCFLHGVSFFYPVLRSRHRRMIKDIRWHVRVKGRLYVSCQLFWSATQ